MNLVTSGEMRCRAWATGPGPILEIWASRSATAMAAGREAGRGAIHHLDLGQAAILQLAEAGSTSRLTLPTLPVKSPRPPACSPKPPPSSPRFPTSSPKLPVARKEPRLPEYLLLGPVYQVLVRVTSSKGRRKGLLVKRGVAEGGMHRRAKVSQQQNDNKHS